MFANAVAAIWEWPRLTVTVLPAPDPKPRPQPLLMGDILSTRGGEPEFLIRWREDRAALNPDDTD